MTQKNINDIIDVFIKSSSLPFFQLSTISFSVFFHFISFGKGIKLTGTNLEINSE